MLTLVVFIIGALSAVYVYYHRSATYWLRRGVAAVPPASIIFGSSHELLQLDNPRLHVFRDWGRKYGKTYGCKEGVRNMLVTSDLDMIQEIFVKQFDNFHSRKKDVLGPDLERDKDVHLFFSRGERWKRLRTLSTPPFSVSSLKKIFPIVEDSVRNMVKLMEERHSGGGTFNIHEFFCEYTMDTIGRLVMGQKESLMFKNPRVAVAKSLFLRDLDIPLIHYNLAIPLLNPLTKLALKQFSNSLTEAAEKLKDEIQMAVKEKIKQRESNEGVAVPTSDFIDLFLDFSAEMEMVAKTDFKMSDAKVAKSLTVDEVCAQAIVFLLAGFDTTANSLGYTSWMLALHPEAMRRCQEEIDEVCCDESISYDDLANLKYVEATCKETLRFYPTGAFANSRECMKETEVCGLIIEKGTDIQVDTHALHFDPTIWGDDAAEFKPERWLDADRRVPSHAFIPFGAGPRICVGMRLAMMEEKIALAHILRKFNIVKGTTATELKLQGSLTVTPVEVPVKIVART